MRGFGAVLLLSLFLYFLYCSMVSFSLVSFRAWKYFLFCS